MKAETSPEPNQSQSDHPLTASCTIQIIDPTTCPDWNTQIGRLPGANIFHTANWARALQSAYNYRCAYLTAFQGTQIVGCLPMMGVRSRLTGRRGVSLPFTDTCNPLWNHESGFERLLAAATAHAGRNKWKHIELRGHQPALSNAPASSLYATHDLDLRQSEQTLFKQFRKSTQRNIRKALKSNLQMHRSSTLEAVRLFYQLNIKTRRSHGLPPQPFRFFKALHYHVIDKNQGFVQYALYNRRPIAAAIFLHFNAVLFYKYGASEKKYQSLRANNLVLWEAIRWGVRNNHNQFNFGRTELDNHGLRRFKNGWGTCESMLPYYRYQVATESFKQQQYRLKPPYWIFRRLPLPLLKLTGQILYRHIG